MCTVAGAITTVVTEFVAFSVIVGTENTASVPERRVEGDDFDVVKLSDRGH